MELREIQLIQLDILKDTLKIIESHSLRYFLLGGSLLGAVRHKGFIPWDDDIDIGLPRKDYDILILEARKSLPEHLMLRHFLQNDGYMKYCARIEDRRFPIRRNDSVHETESYIWIDVFPLDGMPDNPVHRKFHAVKLLTVRAMLQFSNFDKGVNIKKKNRPLSEIILIRSGIIFKHLFKNKAFYFLCLLDSFLKKFTFDGSDYIVNFIGAYKFKEMFPRRFYEPTAQFNFEGLILCGPNQFDKVLTQLYGDYMTPPRIKHTHSIILENNGKKND